MLSFPARHDLNDNWQLGLNSRDTDKRHFHNLALKLAVFAAERSRSPRGGFLPPPHHPPRHKCAYSTPILLSRRPRTKERRTDKISACSLAAARANLTFSRFMRALDANRPFYLDCLCFQKLVNFYYGVLPRQNNIFVSIAV